MTRGQPVAAAVAAVPALLATVLAFGELWGPFVECRAALLEVELLHSIRWLLTPLPQKLLKAMLAPRGGAACG